MSAATSLLSFLPKPWLGFFANMYCRYDLAFLRHCTCGLSPNNGDRCQARHHKPSHRRSRRGRRLRQQVATVGTIITGIETLRSGGGLLGPSAEGHSPVLGLTFLSPPNLAVQRRNWAPK